MKKRFRKIYIEITNICNLSCSFCPGTKRPPTVMGAELFGQIVNQAAEYTDYVYLHLMGEPLLHPQLDRILQICVRQGIRVNLTTNGTLLAGRWGLLLSSDALRKVAFSLHSLEANGIENWQEHLGGILAFTVAARKKGILCELRLWNQDSACRQGENARNDQILKMIGDFLGREVEFSGIGKRHGIRLDEALYLHIEQIFDWPSMQAPQGGKEGFCYGLRDHIGILADGTVVPCCLDSEGSLALGNLQTQPLSEILASARAARIYEGFSNRTAQEELCRRCGYARRFTGREDGLDAAD